MQSNNEVPYGYTDDEYRGICIFHPGSDDPAVLIAQIEDLIQQNKKKEEEIGKLKYNLELADGIIADLYRIIAELLTNDE